MLAGELPHPASTPVALIANKLYDPPASLRERAPGVAVPAPLEDLVRRCLAIDPDDRPHDAHEIELALLELVRSGDTASLDVPEPVDLVGVQLGSYRVTEVIGIGGVGTVYRAEHTEIGTKAAIKVLKPEFAQSSEVAERFLQEARACAALESDLIPRYFDFGRLRDGRAYAVMELLEGECLDRRIARVGRMDVADIVPIVKQTATALKKAHGAGIIHRDLKPENIFLCRTPSGGTSVKVLDFGIAKVASAIGSVKETRVGYFMGTPAYCAPEQIYGAGVGPATDVYALGATIYEMLTGRGPFEGELRSS